MGGNTEKVKVTKGVRQLQELKLKARTEMKDAYGRGFYNGLETAMAILTGMEPKLVHHLSKSPNQSSSGVREYEYDVQ